MTPSCVALGRVIICDLNFKRTENHNFTITTNTSQHVEFFHSLIFMSVILFIFYFTLIDNCKTNLKITSYPCNPTVGMNASKLNRSYFIKPEIKIKYVFFPESGCFYDGVKE